MSIQLDSLLPEVQFQTARSGGPGGQSVNKVETKVELRFHPASSQILADEQKALLLKALGSKLTTDGVLIITAQEERSQARNKELVIKKFLEIIEAGLRKPKKRKKTRPSPEARQKRKEEKQRLSEKKAGRGPVSF